MQVVAEQSGERADDRRDRDADAVAARDERDRNPREQPDLDRAPGARSNRFARFAASATSSASARTRTPDTSGPDRPASTSTTASAPPPTIFTTPVVTRPCASAPRWPRNPRSSPCRRDRRTGRATRTRRTRAAPGAAAASAGRVTDTEGAEQRAAAPRRARPRAPRTCPSRSGPIRPSTIRAVRAPGVAAARGPRRRASGRPAPRRRSRAGRSLDAHGHSRGRRRERRRSRPRRSRSDRRSRPRSARARSTAVSAPCGELGVVERRDLLRERRVTPHGFERRARASAPSRRRPFVVVHLADHRRHVRIDAAPARGRPSCRSPQLTVGSGEHEHARRARRERGERRSLAVAEVEEAGRPQRLDHVTAARGSRVDRVPRAGSRARAAPRGATRRRCPSRAPRSAATCRSFGESSRHLSSSHNTPGTSAPAARTEREHRVHRAGVDALLGDDRDRDAVRAAPPPRTPTTSARSR